METLGGHPAVDKRVGSLLWPSYCAVLCLVLRDFKVEIINSYIRMTSQTFAPNVELRGKQRPIV